MFVQRRQPRVSDIRTTLPNRRSFLASAAAATAAPSLIAAPSAPNLVLIVADDLGYGSLGCYGERQIPTPAIDSLARDSVRFTDGYVSCPVCSPTRAGLLTGRYQQRFGHEFNPAADPETQARFGLPLNQTTLPERLKSLGYRTGMVGKWHLGDRPDFHPLKRGFDEFYGFLGGAHPYFTPGRQGAPILRGAQRVDEAEYLTDAFAREAESFIGRAQSRPFFLYLPFNAVHAPLEAPPQYLSRVSSIADQRRRTYAAMQIAMDDAVARVLKRLKSEALEDNTLVAFISDNGGPTHLTTSSNAPLRGEKRDTWEGGIRVPFVLKFPGRIKPGTASSLPVISLDLLPTLLSAAGGQPKKDWGLDGVDLMPFLRGEAKGRPHEALYWRFGQYWAVRQGDWKLTRSAAGEPGLYNLREDISESRDLSSANPAKRRELLALWEEWNKRLEPPRWRGLFEPLRDTP